MTEVVLVGCTKTKREHPAEARDLYDESALFRKRRRVARLRGDWWSILSAEHGIVRPENWVEPYDTYIGNVDTEAWAEKVLDVLLDDLARHDDPTVTIFAGKKYVDPLVPDLEAEGYEVLDPLRGLMPGQRMSKLDDMADETEQATLVQTDGGCNNQSQEPDNERGIYLAGPVENDDTPRSWRDELRDRYPEVNWIDPMDWQDDWENDPETVWERELRTCRSGAVLVCNIGSEAPRTTGTHHEIREALNHDQPVAIVPEGDISQIYREIEDVDVFDNVDEAVATLLENPMAVYGGETA